MEFKSPKGLLTAVASFLTLALVSVNFLIDYLSGVLR